MKKKLLSLTLITVLSSTYSANLELQVKSELPICSKNFKIHQIISRDNKGNYQLDILSENELDTPHQRKNFSDAHQIIAQYEFTYETEQKSKEFLLSVEKLLKSINIHVTISTQVEKKNIKSLVKGEFKYGLLAIEIGIAQSRYSGNTKFRDLLAKLTNEKMSTTKNKEEIEKLFSQTKSLFEKNILPILEKS